MNPAVIGLFGGSFDPFHNAHLRMAQAFIAEVGLTELRLIPAGWPYHRETPCLASPADRLAMVKLGIKNQPQMRVDDREVLRKHPAYTIDTLREIRKELGQDVTLWFLTGADSFMKIHTWKDWKTLFDYANLAIALRPGIDLRHLEPAVQKELSARFTALPHNLSPSGTILPLGLPPLDLSASVIRETLEQHQDIATLVPAAIASYIYAHNLYQ